MLDSLMPNNNINLIKCIYLHINPNHPCCVQIDAVGIFEGNVASVYAHALSTCVQKLLQSHRQQPTNYLYFFYTK